MRGRELVFLGVAGLMSGYILADLIATENSTWKLPDSDMIMDCLIVENSSRLEGYITAIVSATFLAELKDGVLQEMTCIK